MCVARCSAREAMKQRVGGGRREGRNRCARRGGTWWGENSGGMTESSAIPFTVQFDDGEKEEEGLTISDDGRLE